MAVRLYTSSIRKAEAPAFSLSFLKYSKNKLTKNC